jgi:hypothetical protein
MSKSEKNSLKSLMVDQLILADEKTPVPDNALTFDELHKEFCERMGWQGGIKRLRIIIAEKVDSGHWKRQRSGQQVYYWIA